MDISVAWILRAVWPAGRMEPSGSALGAARGIGGFGVVWVGSPHISVGDIVGILGGGQGGSGPQAISLELYFGWLFSPPLVMVVEVFQGTELKN